MADTNRIAEPADSQAILGPGHDFATVTDKVASIVLTKGVSKKWLIGFAIAFALVNLLFLTIANLLFNGIGIWGVNVPVGWGFDIINFVWWIGIGHAGTLISAILLLLRQQWRTSINRFAEAMTLFAVACAGLYPLLHMGRPWFFYWLMPYPNTMQLWPQWRSPLVWDVFAVTTYATTSALFWYVGLIPDLATLRDRAKSRFARIVYGVLSMGWRNSALHWHRYEICYMLLAGLATPLVISVHTVVSFDFAAGIVPGWHATIFPPYFVAGAIYAGFAMVLLLTIPLRAIYGVADFITDKHLDNMAKILLATGLMVTYGYAVEIFMGWYSGEHTELFLVQNRLNGFNSLAYYSLLLCNALAPQVLWFRWARRSTTVLFIVSLIVSVGMWLERFVIIVGSLRLDYAPSAWGNYQGTPWDWSMFLGTIGLFFALLFLFVRLLPMISIFEMRTLLPDAELPHHAAEAHVPEEAAHV